MGQGIFQDLTHPLPLRGLPKKQTVHIEGMHIRRSACLDSRDGYPTFQHRQLSLPQLPTLTIFGSSPPRRGVIHGVLCNTPRRIMTHQGDSNHYESAGRGFSLTSPTFQRIMGR